MRLQGSSVGAAFRVSTCSPLSILGSCVERATHEPLAQYYSNLATLLPNNIAMTIPPPPPSPPLPRRLAPSPRPSLLANSSVNTVPPGPASSPFRGRRLSYLEAAASQKRPAILHATPARGAESPTRKSARCGVSLLPASRRDALRAFLPVVDVPRIDGRVVPPPPLPAIGATTVVAANEGSPPSPPTVATAEKPPSKKKTPSTRQKNINKVITTGISEWARVGTTFGDKVKNIFTTAEFDK